MGGTLASSPELEALVIAIGMKAVTQFSQLTLGFIPLRAGSLSLGKQSLYSHGKVVLC